MEKPNILFLGFTVPEHVAKRAFTLDSNPAVQTHKFAWSMARALKSGFGRIVLASSCPIQNYPLGRKIFFKSERFQQEHIEGVLLGFINIIILKHITRFLSCLLVLPRLMASHKVEYLFIHGLHTPYLLFGLLARTFGKKLVVILTDPPGVILPSDGILSRALKRLDVWLVRRALEHSDAVIALAPELVKRFAVRIPALVFPGILDSSLEAQISSARTHSSSTETFTIVYAGGLSSAYGIDRLIDAITGIDDSRVRLKLFGRGDQENRIKSLSSKDDRFEYGGFVGNETLIPELLSADLLINPRPDTESFALMSFPSKLIEYLATGRPVLTTRIASIPDSYKPHFLYINEASEDGIRNAILDVLKKDKNQLNEFASLGQTFISNEASEISIGNRIYKFINPESSK